jgi:UDP-glucose:(heptosyl)LPS alpha-1,3-glucosyltransferase
MHVALVHMRHAPTGGTERYLNQLALHLAERGHEVTIVCRSHAEPPHAAVRFEVLREPAVGGAWRMWAFAKSVERHVAASSYDVVVGLGKTWTHDVVRLGGGTHQSYLELAHASTLEPWERATFKGALKHRLALRIEARALAHGAYGHVITNSHMVRRDVMERYGVPEDALTVVHNGVDLERFGRAHHGAAAAALRAECGWNDDDVAVLFLGTGYGRKGLAHALAAFPSVLRERPAARLVVAGRDSAKARYEHMAASLGLAERVTFLGERKDAECVFAAADVYVLPTQYDPFANTTLEALASGLPVVTTEHNGGAEVLDENSGSVLERTDDPDEIAAALVHWTDPERLLAAREATRRVAAEHPRERTARESTAVIEAAAAHAR